jgi:hypothetical protein
MTTELFNRTLHLWAPACGGSVAPLLRLCCGSDLNFISYLPRCCGCCGSRGGEAGVRHPADRLTPPYRSSALHAGNPLVTYSNLR